MRHVHGCVDAGGDGTQLRLASASVDSATGNNVISIYIIIAIAITITIAIIPQCPPLRLCCCFYRYRYH